MSVIALYIGCVVGANWLAEDLGAVGIGFGLHAAAAVYVAGPVLVVRDWVQRLAGLRASLLAVAAGTVLSCLVAGPAIATASAVSFAVSEVLDAAVYSVVVRRGGVVVAVLCSGMVGLVVDSLLFPAIAFACLALTPGHLLGKAYGVLAGTILTAVVRRRL
ncbi:VUT family protein [Amycolatopsis mongoliensis]|uniref:VUT family protein n=1 Tax=Amycolatopsis mongoliensis TaxID=715475 RepID=A0A9Y2JVP1_9PSEU|nr:VUT family protein [Amycolatopsis sp. 4-36]WIY05548.1 VUT family protein [Amycolatopsis sp. 4-36]